MARGELRITLFGPPKARVGETPVEVDTRKAIAVLAYLAATGRRQSRARLAALLWPEYSEERAKAALRRTLSALRTGLSGEWLVATRHEVGLEGSGVSSDVGDFRSLLATVETHGHDDVLCESCETQLEGAVDLYRGDFMEGFSVRDSSDFDDWQFLETESLRKDLSRALDQLAESRAARDDFDRALGLAERRLILDPLDESTYRRLMLFHARKGERSEAMRRYRDLVGILDRELGVQPLAETTALYDATAQGDIVVKQPPPSPEPLAMEATATYPLVGRDTELQKIDSLYDGVDKGGRLVVIEGEAGIGKTRLAEEVLDRVAARGGVIVAARSREGESGLAYGLAAELLRALLAAGNLGAVPVGMRRDLSRLLPELEGETNVDSLDEPGARTRFFESIRLFVRSALNGSVPGALFLDDLQWADSASLELVSYLVRRLEGFPVCMVAVWRSEEAGVLQHLTRLSDYAGPASLVVTPARLSPKDVGRLARAAPLTREVDEPLIERLVEETEGIPFFVTEYLSVLAQSEQEPWPLPEGIKSLLSARLQRISDAGRQLLTAAAVIARDFDIETAVRTSGRSDMETVDALDELVGKGLIWATPSVNEVPAYRFSHDRLRSFVYEEMSPARRRLLHRRAAEALSIAEREDPGAIAGLIARHLALAGEDSGAARAYSAAGDHARQLFANSEALAHYESALALGHPEKGRLHEGIGDLRLLEGDYVGAVTAYEIAAANVGKDELHRIEHKLGEVHQRRGEWDIALSHLSAALQGFQGAGDLSGAARTTADLSLTAYRAGQRSAAEQHARGAIELATRADDPSAIAQAENILGILANARGAPKESAAHLKNSLQLAEALGDISARVAALNNLALAARAAGDLELSIALTTQALETCKQRGDRHREAALHNNLADLLHAMGDSEAAMVHLKTATRIFAEVGEDEGKMLPEVWKLIEW